MARHCFNFEGGDMLTTMGASWFVSYAYHLYVNNEHTNWREVGTYQNRQSVFSQSKEYHRFFFEKIIEMNESRLETNTLGLKGREVIRMAEEIWRKKYGSDRRS
jgi:hypothetical protein